MQVIEATQVIEGMQAIKATQYLEPFFIYTNGIHVVSLFLHEVNTYHLGNHKFT